MYKCFLVLLLLACAGTETAPVNKPILLPEVKVDGTLNKIPQPDKIIERPKLSREKLLKPIFETLDKFCEDKNLFDEPRGEPAFDPLNPNETQEDGSLRPHWLQAYLHGRRSYYFNHPEHISKYYVFGKNTTPLPPMVCPDFIVDTLERSSGTWYRSSYTNPGRDIGKLEIRETAKAQGFDVRRVLEFVNYLRTQPENYQFIYDGWGAKVGKVKTLKIWLKEKDVQLGDIIIIQGRAPWDLEQGWHNHSMIVSELDKDGQVSYITGNSDWVMKRKLEYEVARAPKRRVKYIIRLTDHLLENLK